MVVAVAGISRAADLASPAPKPEYSEIGVASWYGYPYHDHPAADGEIYDMDKLTAAHRTLPFGTVVRVVNLANDKTVDVRINDRGPFIDGRIIDLSRAAARAIDLEQTGVIPVRIDVISDLVRIPARPDDPEPAGVIPAQTEPVADSPRAPATGLFAVQVGAFRDYQNADRYAAAMKARYGSARLAVRDGEPKMWRVLVGTEETSEMAGGLAARIHQDSVECRPFVVRLDP